MAPKIGKTLFTSSEVRLILTLFDYICARANRFCLGFRGYSCVLAKDVFNVLQARWSMKAYSKFHHVQENPGCSTVVASETHTRRTCCTQSRDNAARIMPREPPSPDLVLAFFP